MNDYFDIITEKYSSQEMRNLFSEHDIVRTYRECWIALAEAEHELGIKEITKQMILEMKKNIQNFDLPTIKEKEKETKHDIAAHIHAYGEVCPYARAIIHLGATSQFVKCNTDMIIQRKALSLIRKKLIILLAAFSKQIKAYKDIPTLGYTHFQSAQPTTIGRRLCNYAQDLLSDLEELDRVSSSLKLRGAKGTTGTQATFLTLFSGNHNKVKKLDSLIAKKLGFKDTYPLTTQTYSRKEDIRIHTVLAGIAASLKRFATDLRLLSSIKVMEEPFGQKQVGSSAMPYKQNPVQSERITSLSRKITNNLQDFYETYAEQWLERSLDDSAIRRIDIPQNFMLTEYVIELATGIMKDIIINKDVSEKLLMQELPFLATEEIILAAVKKGKDRQTVHEAIKEHAITVTKKIKQEGGENNLLERLFTDERIGLTLQELERLLNPTKFLGRSSAQAEEFLTHLNKQIKNP